MKRAKLEAALRSGFANVDAAIVAGQLRMDAYKGAVDIWVAVMGEEIAPPRPSRGAVATLRRQGDG